MRATPQRDLVSAMLVFGRHLRAAGLPVTVSQLMDAVRALEVVDLFDRAETQLALRSTLVTRLAEIPAFDRCFDAFWRYHAAEGQGLDGLASMAPAPGQDDEALVASPGAASQRKGSPVLEAWEEGAGDEGEPLEVPGMSDRELLVERDFSSFTAGELDEIARLTVLIARRMARRVSRRKRPVRRGGVVDLRRSIRANMMKGEIVELRRRERRRRKIRLLLLCDVSGSMDLYSRFLLQFVYALQNVFGRVETFTFATRLTRVTELLRGPSYRQALRRLAEVRDFSGGTRIGACLGDFNANWGHLLDRRTVTVILSDGWDTGEPEDLAVELLRIKRKVGRLIWLNPLLGNPSYEPLTRGMAAALPLLDRFAAAHNLASLRELAAHLTLR